MSGDDDRRLVETVERYGATFCCKTDFELLKKIKNYNFTINDSYINTRFLSREIKGINSSYFKYDGR